VELVTPDIERALNYVYLLTNSGYSPSLVEIDEFVTTKLPTPSSTTTKLNHALIRGAFGDLLSPHWVAGGKVSEYMVRMGWLRVSRDEKAHLTSSGGALLSGLSQFGSDLNAGARVYTSTPERPIAVSQLVSLIQQHNSETYIDPYLDADHVDFLFTQTSISKILTSDRYLPAISVRLAELDLEASSEVRIVRGGALHDRAVLHEDGGIALIGTSFKKIESKFVGLVDLPAALAQGFRAAMEELWSRAEVVIPSHPDSSR
jgi:hypothetical protein